MAAVLMFIEKFGKEVLIDEDHPLAVAQKQGGAVSASGVGLVPVACEPAAETPAPACVENLSFAQLRTEAKARGINCYQKSADELRALLQGA